ncbi:YHS domain-containing protein [Chishuiella sp.]|uniref:YHS domain-containing protein n=1 Tax=Chishuiella sp. TaxID=1969467 RepID=UPI0028B08323|nr:YHS domain-containing protein [Chishuiella sp.]
MNTKTIISLLTIFLIALTYGQYNNIEANKNKIKETKASIDPICKMKVSNNSKDTVIYKKKVYVLCSSFCKEKFKKDPKKYLN